MNEQEIMERIILPTIHSANISMPYFAIENPTPETSLYGTDHAVLDSLNLVTFVFLLEEQMKKVAGRAVTISPQDILGHDNPFSSLAKLAKFVEAKIGHE